MIKTVCPETPKLKPDPSPAGIMQAEWRSQQLDLMRRPVKVNLRQNTARIMQKARIHLHRNSCTTTAFTGPPLSPSRTFHPLRGALQP